MLILLKSCMLNGLTKYNIFNDRKDAINRYLEAQLTILDDKKEELIELIKLTPKGGIFDKETSLLGVSLEIGKNCTLSAFFNQKKGVSD
ncbi:hypothetical protein DAI92_004867 [Salmonella enterica subsp. enterica serovar Bredeney]|nr:hypothetical protein [Salmonella enterica subsp. enterica serovar Bredeney]